MNFLIYIHKNYTNDRTICGNCGNSGHVYKDCSGAFKSFGIIAMRRSPNDSKVPLYIDKELNRQSKVKILLVRRKDSISYVDFVRGRYNIVDDLEMINKPKHISNSVIKLFENMTITEREYIKSHTFDELWKTIYINPRYQEIEYKHSKKLYECLDIKYIIENTSSKWSYPEWGFPKGRKHIKETIFKGALREFEEETNYKSETIKTFSKTPITEKLIGTNGFAYEQIYYLGILDSSASEPKIDKLNNEIGDICFLTYKEAKQVFRQYENTKFDILDKIFSRI